MDQLQLSGIIEPFVGNSCWPSVCDILVRVLGLQNTALSVYYYSPNKDGANPDRIMVYRVIVSSTLETPAI